MRCRLGRIFLSEEQLKKIDWANAPSCLRDMPSASPFVASVPKKRYVGVYLASELRVDEDSDPVFSIERAATEETTLRSGLMNHLGMSSDNPYIIDLSNFRLVSLTNVVLGDLTEQTEFSDCEKLVVFGLTDLSFRTLIRRATLAKWAEELSRGGQMVLAGASGTGKTWAAQALGEYVLRKHCTKSACIL